MSKILIVLGMHRSGTSLVSGWLTKCNLNLGDRLLGANTANENGYFEDLDFLNLHEEILTYYKIVSTGLIPPFDFELNEYYYKKLKSNIGFKNSLHKQWGWKEPRTCLFINYYKKLLPKAKYFILYRDYEFVVESLIRRDYISLNMKFHGLTEKEQINHSGYFETELKNLLSLIDVYLSVWIIYNQNILDLIASLNKSDYIIVKYNRLIENDKMIFKQLKVWKFKLKYYPFSSIFDSELINESLPDITFNNQLECKAIEIRDKMISLLN
jgi:hypothetical protein